MCAACRAVEAHAARSARVDAHRAGGSPAEHDPPSAGLRAPGRASVAAVERDVGQAVTADVAHDCGVVKVTIDAQPAGAQRRQADTAAVSLAEDHPGGLSTVGSASIARSDHQDVGEPIAVEVPRRQRARLLSADAVRLACQYEHPHANEPSRRDHDGWRNTHPHGHGSRTSWTMSNRGAPYRFGRLTSART